MRATLLAILPLLLAGGPGVRELAGQAADLIVTNARIVTADRQNAVHAAMAIRGGRILRVGTAEAVETARGPSTRMVDLGGKTVLPGLIDSHTHASEAGLAEFDHQVPTLETIPQVLDYVSARAAAVGPGEWVVVRQIFLTRVRERRNPTRAELDEAAPRNPVIFQTGAEMLLNSRGLERVGVRPGFKEPAGSKVEKDPRTGEPTGVIRGWKAFIDMPPERRVPTRQDRENLLRAVITDYNATGITSFSDRRVSEEDVQLYEALLKEGKLTARVSLSKHVDTAGPTDSVVAAIRAVARHHLMRGGPLLRMIGVKTFADGGMLSGSSHMLEPWGVSEIFHIEDPEYRGLPLIEPAKLRTIARTAIEEGLQFTAHAVGDAAVALVVRTYAALSDSLPDAAIRRTRPSVTHANFIADSTINTMARHGVVADIQPIWFYMDGATLLSHFGERRMGSFQPFRSLRDRGVIFGGGSDHMRKIGSLRSINPYNPFLGMWATIARRPRESDAPLHPEHALTRMEAIRMYTIDNAFLLFREDDTGSLEPGKFADFIVLDRDILSCREEEIREIQVLSTYLGGELVHGGKAN